MENPLLNELVEILLRPRIGRTISQNSTVREYIEILSFCGEIYLTSAELVIRMTIIGQYVHTVSLNKYFDLVVGPFPEAYTVCGFPDIVGIIETLLRNGYRQYLSPRLIRSELIPQNIEGEIGKGTYGSVLRINTPTGRFAKKTVDLRLRTGEIDPNSIREICLNAKIRSPFVTPITSFVIDRVANVVSIIMPLAETDMFKANQALRINRSEYLTMTYQLLKGLSQMHSIGIRHRDIKPGNILLYPIASDSNVGYLIPGGSGDLLRYRFCYTDFGIGTANECATGKGDQQFDVYTNWYRPPEILLATDADYDDLADIWALGATLAEIYIHKSLFAGASEQDIVRNIFTLLGTPTNEEWPEAREYPRFPHDMWQHASSWQSTFPADPLFNLIRSMLTYNPRSRPTASMLLRNPIFDQIRGKVEETLMTVSRTAIGANPMDYIVSDRIFDLTCIQRLQTSRPMMVKVPSRTSPRDYMKIVGTLYSNLHANPIFNLRSFFLAHYYITVLTTRFNIRDLGNPEQWIFAAMVVASKINSPVIISQVAMQGLDPNFDQIQLEIISVVEWNCFVTTSYDFWQATSAYYTLQSRNVAISILLFTTQFPTLDKFLVDEIALGCSFIGYVVESVMAQRPIIPTTHHPSSDYIVDLMRNQTGMPIFEDYAKARSGLTIKEMIVILDTRTFAGSVNVSTVMFSPVRGHSGV